MYAVRQKHPPTSRLNIVTAYDADEVGGVHFLVMEYVNGTNLAELLVQRGKFSVSEAVDYVIQTARGLGYAHGEGVIHRDIKPGNLLLDKRGVVKILDMGLASIQQTQDSEDAPTQHDVTQANQLLGTFDYMPPEQAEDPHSVDQRADVYSLGCTLYRLLTGQLPYRGDSAIKKILAHRDHPIPSILALRSDVPAEIDRIFHNMVAKRPEARYQSMAAVIDDLEKAVRPREGFIPGTGQSEKIDSGRESSTWSLGSERDEFRLEPVGGRLRSSEEVTRVPTASDSDDEFGFQLAPPMDQDRYYWQCMGASAMS